MAHIISDGPTDNAYVVVLYNPTTEQAVYVFTHSAASAEEFLEEALQAFPNSKPVLPVYDLAMALDGSRLEIRESLDNEGGSAIM